MQNNESAESYAISNVSTLADTFEARQARSGIKPKSHLNQKMRVLRVQTFIFFVFFCSWFPFVVLSPYEIIAEIKTYDILSKMRNFTVSFVLINGIVTPIVYTYRLKYMKKFFARLDIFSCFSKKLC